MRVSAGVGVTLSISSCHVSQSLHHAQDEMFAQQLVRSIHCRTDRSSCGRVSENVVRRRRGRLSSSRDRITMAVETWRGSEGMRKSGSSSCSSSGIGYWSGNANIVRTANGRISDSGRRARVRWSSHIQNNKRNRNSDFLATPSWIPSVANPKVDIDVDQKRKQIYSNSSESKEEDDTIGKEMDEGNIIPFLKGQNILITGATGFLAKLLVEKILYEQPEVGHIYLLIQPRGDATAEQRLETLIESPVFDRLRAKYAAAAAIETATGEENRFQNNSNSSHDNFHPTNGNGNGHARGTPPTFVSFSELISSKLTAIPGNVGLSNLGLSAAHDILLREHVTIIVNSAATTTFDEQYDVAIQVNTLGALHCVQYAQKTALCSKIVHVSTAFVNGTRKGYTPEKMFVPNESIKRELEGDNGKSPILDIDKEIEEAMNLNNGKTNMKDMQEKLKAMGLSKARAYGWQDTYVFTKAMGEMLVSREITRYNSKEKSGGPNGDNKKLSVAVIRPSIVESSFREPVRGWIEGIRMCDPIIIAYGKGQIDGFCGDQNGVLDVVPADMVINAMLASMPTLQTGKADEAEECNTSNSIHESSSISSPCIHNNLKVYHVATSVSNPLSNRTFVDAVSNHFRDSPMKDKRGNDIVVPDMAIFTSVESYGLNLFFRYQFPILMKRFLERVMPWRKKEKGAKRRKDFIIQKTYEQLTYLADIYRPYTFYECRFGAENTERLFDNLHPSERQKFNFDLKEIDWREYLSSVHVNGIRQYVLQGRK